MKRPIYLIDNRLWCRAPSSKLYHVGTWWRDARCARFPDSPVPVATTDTCPAGDTVRRELRVSRAQWRRLVVDAESDQTWGFALEQHHKGRWRVCGWLKLGTFGGKMRGADRAVLDYLRARIVRLDDAAGEAFAAWVATQP